MIQIFPLEPDLLHLEGVKLFSDIIYDTNDLCELPREEIEKIKIWIHEIHVGRNIKKILMDVLELHKKLNSSEKEYLLYCLIKGKSLLESIRVFPDQESSCRAIDMHIMNEINVSAQLASEIRKCVVLYAANTVKDDVEHFNDLLYYGGIK